MKESLYRQVNPSRDPLNKTEGDVCHTGKSFGNFGLKTIKIQNLDTALRLSILTPCEGCILYI